MGVLFICAFLDYVAFFLFHSFESLISENQVVIVSKIEKKKSKKSSAFVLLRNGVTTFAHTTKNNRKKCEEQGGRNTKENSLKNSFYESLVSHEDSFPLIPSPLVTRHWKLLSDHENKYMLFCFCW